MMKVMAVNLPAAVRHMILRLFANNKKDTRQLPFLQGHIIT
jgi:hypothetical protein